MPLSKARNRQRMRLIRLHEQLGSPQFTMRLRERKIKPIRSCEVCGFNSTVDTHHEGELREEHSLCPNCHALITRRVKTLEQLLPPQESKPVQPKSNSYEITDNTPLVTGIIGYDADGNPIYED